MTFDNWKQEVLTLIELYGFDIDNYDLDDEGLEYYNEGYSPQNYVWTDRRDYYIIVDENDEVVGTAEVRKDSMSDDEILHPHKDRVFSKLHQVHRRDLIEHREKHINSSGKNPKLNLKKPFIVKKVVDKR